MKNKATWKNEGLETCVCRRCGNKDEPWTFTEPRYDDVYYEGLAALDRDEFGENEI